MRQQFGMNQKMQQRMIMTPMLQQAMKILQLSTLELKEWVEKEMVENPVLEEDNEEAPSETPTDKLSPGPVGEAPPDEIPTSDAELSFDKLRQTHQTDLVEHIKDGDRFQKDTWELYSEGQDYGESSDGAYGGNENSQAEQERRDFFEASITRAQTLAESLEWQLLLVAHDEEDKTLGKVIIGNLDENGYLTDTPENIARFQGISLERAEKMLSIIQGFEPVGVGARDLRECLLLQLENRIGELAQKAYRVVHDHFEDMEKKRYPVITRNLDCSNEQLKEILEYIATLEPKPGRSFESEGTKYITPDVSVRFIDGDYVVVLNDEPVPRLRISSYYRRLMKDKSVLNGKETKKFLENKIQSALWLIKNIEQRRKTIFRVTEAIFRIQRDFLDTGISALKPLTLKQVADIIGMHESTVSRVTTHKYVQTPRGLFELKFFFTSGLESSDGMDVSSLSVKEKIKDMVSNESNQKPLSDQKIMQMLNEQGLSIARRTIAKYREELRIPTASQRRKL
jgi:RNA polymerase sigma-54 factor